MLTIKMLLKLLLKYTKFTKTITQLVIAITWKTTLLKIDFFSQYEFEKFYLRNSFAYEK